ncbi:MAG: hypothetical protein QY331_10545 [Melioribacteraceae bacterium]|nr:MAG: hypothetical protein QY331_10545 [Melioribacteraceae bacterium]
MKNQTFEFSVSKIRKHLEQLKKDSDKLAYVYWLKREIGKRNIDDIIKEHEVNNNRVDDEANSLYRSYKLCINEIEYYEKKLPDLKQQLDNKINFDGKIKDFAFIMDRLISGGYIKKDLKMLASHFTIQGDNVNNKDISDAMSKIRLNTEGAMPTEKMENLFK